MKNTSPTAAQSEGSKVRWAREARLAAIVILGSLLVVPAVIYAVGASILGSYAGGDGIGAFYGDFLRNLGSGTVRSWLLLLAPYLLLNLLRAIFWPWKRNDGDPDSSKQTESDRRTPPSASREPHGRRDPFVSQ